ncbi:hypothetical protein GCM10020216_022320 [Nonomuraea helvata]
MSLPNLAFAIEGQAMAAAISCCHVSDQAGLVHHVAFPARSYREGFGLTPAATTFAGRLLLAAPGVVSTLKFAW